MATLLGVTVAFAVILTTCAYPEPQVIERVVKETVVVEVEKAIEVPKIIQVTREVEVMRTVQVTPTPVPEKEEEVTLDWNLGTDPVTLDPSLAADRISIDLLRNLQVGLTQLSTDGQVQPMLATEWDISEDGLEYTFKLRDDARWVRYNSATDEIEVQRSVTAHDVVYGTKRSLDPRTTSDYAHVLYVIKGGQALNASDIDALSEEEQLALLDGVGVEALDDYSVKFTLESPAPYFPGIASMWVMRPMPREPIEAVGDGWVEPGSYWSNGPMVMAEWAHDDHVLLLRNPFYWDAHEVQLDRIRGVMITDPYAAFVLYETNQLDVTVPSLRVMDRVKADPVLSKELYIVPRDCTYYYGFTVTKPPVDDVRVRKALSAAIDRWALIEDVSKGSQLPANTFAPPMIFGSAAGDPDIAPWMLDHELGKERAKEWLAEAGYPGGEGFPAITLMYNTSEVQQKIAQAIAAMWKDVLGVDATIDRQDYRGYLEAVARETPLEEMPHVWRSGWCGSYPDQHGWLYEVFHAEKGDGKTRATRSRFELHLEAALLESDPGARQVLYEAAESILVEDEARMAPIYYYATAVLIKPWVAHRVFADMGGTPLYQWRLDWEGKRAGTRE